MNIVSLSALALLLPFTATAANLDCSVQAPKSTSTANLQKMAKVSANDAKSSAVSALKWPGATANKGGVGVQDGCLVYSYDVTAPGRSALQVIVDAGNGKVLAVKPRNGSDKASK
jgi:uncharacterized membrane protein YkoI